MAASSASTLDRLTAECCQELFAAYGLSLTPREGEVTAAQDRLLFCSVMGFGGCQMKGALTLVSTVEPLQCTHSGPLPSLPDWVRELSNQLMGRVKNRLLRLGAEVLLATPAAVSGDELDLDRGRRSPAQVFEAAGGLVWAWMECECCDGFELSPTPNGGLEPMLVEGDFLLF